MCNKYIICENKQRMLGANQGTGTASARTSQKDKIDGKSVSGTAGHSKDTREQVSKLKKFLLGNDAGAVRQGIEIARVLGDVRVFDYFLEGLHMMRSGTG